MAEYTNLKEGKEYEARLVYVNDLGIHTNEYKGEKKPDVRKRTFAVEVLGETVELEDGPTVRTLFINPFNSFDKMSEKGKEFEYMKVFDSKAKPDTAPDWEAQLGKPCVITVKHAVSKKDKNIKFDNIDTISAIPEKYQAAVEEGTLEPQINNVNKLRGLVKWVYDQRIDDAEDTAPEPEDKDDDTPY